MKYFQRASITEFVTRVILEDRQVSHVTDGWNLGKEDIIPVIIRHFHDLGVFHVEPLAHAEMIYQSILFQLSSSVELTIMHRKVQEEIQRSKAKQARRSS